MVRPLRTLVSKRCYFVANLEPDRMSSGGVFSRGGDSLVVPLSLHKENRTRLMREFRFPSENHILVIFGGQELPMYNSDTVWDAFRQESYFQWLVGAKEPGLAVTLNYEGSATLFVPDYPASYETWMGPRKTLDAYKQEYGVEFVEYVDKLAANLAHKSILCLTSVNLDSGLAIARDKRLDGLPVDEENSAKISVLLDELRAVKTAEEIKILQFANDVSCKAHLEVMREMFGDSKFPCSSREFFAEAVFRFGCAARGCARVGYGCIACSGERNAILHYGHAAAPNNEDLPSSSHLRLLDMGAEYHCYTADVTNTFPSSGRFSDLQKAVYMCVWSTVLHVEETLLKPGAHYRDLHIQAQRHLLIQLTQRTELIKPEFRTQIDYLVDDLNIVPRLLMPHGLGHMLGLNVHDVGGHLPGEQKSNEVSVRGLRLSRPLLPGFVLTVEPGIYFIDYLRETATPEIAEVVDWDVWLQMKREVGGVRIEDDVLITETGCRVLTDLPRTPEDVEAVMRGGKEWTVGANYREYNIL